MPTPSIQTLVTDAQQVLNLDSISAVRSVVAVALANANTGTPLNPNLTTQQLWNEFYQVVTKPKSDIESIIANQLMKFLFAPPAPGGVGANKQVIFNDGGVLAGDADFTYNKATNFLRLKGTLNLEQISGGSNTWQQYVYTDGTLRLNYNGAGADEIVIGTTGNIAVGGFEPGVFSSGFYKTIELGKPGCGILAATPPLTGSELTYFIGNAILAYTTTPVWYYGNNGEAGVYGIENGNHRWYNGQSGTANTTTITNGSAYIIITSGNQTAFGAPNNSAGTTFVATSSGTLTSGTVSETINLVQAMALDLSSNLLLTGNVVPANGKGIDFSATPQPAGATSELLNDYEEGTFTPAITGGTTAGTATYVGRSGKYTKIGNQVHVQIFIDWNSHTGTGDTRITGLPFTNGANFSGAVVGYANAITVTAGYFIAAYVDAAQPWILLNQIPTGGGTNQTVPIDPAGILVVSATYTV
jgi:hypothetical protein